MSNLQHVVNAAGAIVYRWNEGSQNPDEHLDDPLAGLEVCTVHRPRYGDTSWPKGKLENNESWIHAATREVGEETGFPVALQSHMTTVEYDLAYEGKASTKGVKKRGIRKTVNYWIGHPLDDDAAQMRGKPFGPVADPDEGEISGIDWMTPHDARKALTRRDDKASVDEFVRRVRNGSAFAVPFVIMRHGKAEGRKSWHAYDGLRPLTPRGAGSAYAEAREIACFAPLDLYSSPWKRCADTIAMYAAQTGQDVTMVPELTEDAFADDPDAAWAALYATMDACASRRRPAAVCMHRPVIGGMIDHLREICLTPALAKIVPGNNPYLPTGHAIALGLIPTPDGPRITDIQKVSPIVY
ncbi:MAG: NUDIX domain-containing protein [Pseudoscardovia radai]|nr:NUDIX domain-containing protein [Pseudoscardovia radai]